MNSNWPAHAECCLGVPFRTLYRKNMSSSSSDDDDILKYASVALSGDDVIRGASNKEKRVGWCLALPKYGKIHVVESNLINNQGE